MFSMLSRERNPSASLLTSSMFSMFRYTLVGTLVSTPFDFMKGSATNYDVLNVLDGCMFS